MPDILYKDESYAIIGACFEVFNTLGSGFLEAVYQECLQIELDKRGIPYIAQGELKLTYKGIPLDQTFKPDFICYGKIIVEIKAVADLNDVFRAQLHNYLRATNLRLGLLVNFGAHPQLDYERIVR